MTNANVARAIAAAQSKAAEAPAATAAPAATTTLPATAAPAAAAPAPGRRRTIEDMIAQAGLSISNWVSVTKFGIQLNKSKNLVPTLLVELKLREVQPITAISWTTNGVTNFGKTYDGVIEAKSGRPWADVVAQAAQVHTGDGSPHPFESSEIPLRLLADFEGKRPNGEAIALSTGTLIGFSTSKANQREFQTFLLDVVTKHGLDTPLKVELGFKSVVLRSNETPILTWAIAEDTEAKAAAKAA